MNTYLILVWLAKITYPESYVVSGNTPADALCRFWCGNPPRSYDGVIKIEIYTRS